MHFETHAPAIEQPHPVAYRNAHGGTLAKPHCNAHHDTNACAIGTPLRRRLAWLRYKDDGVRSSGY